MFQKFSLTAQQPKLQNSCSQMWLIEQLYIELGVDEKRFFVKSKFFKKRGATFFMTSHVSSALSILPNIGQNHQVSCNLTSF